MIKKIGDVLPSKMKELQKHKKEASGRYTKQRIKSMAKKLIEWQKKLKPNSNVIKI
jgi:hypothetical protein